MRRMSKMRIFPKEVSMQKHVARVPSDHFPVMIVVEVK